MVRKVWAPAENLGGMIAEGIQNSRDCADDRRASTQTRARSAFDPTYGL
jgi:hypothetical protein